MPDAPEPGDAIAIDVDARDASFAPVPDATVDATLTVPGGATQPLKLRHADPAGGRFTAALGPEQRRPLPHPRRGAARHDVARQRPIAGCTSAAPIASSPIRG